MKCNETMPTKPCVSVVCVQCGKVCHKIATHHESDVEP